MTSPPKQSDVIPAEAGIHSTVLLLAI